MSQRYSRSEVDIDRYESDRRSTYTPSRARYAEPDIDFRRGSGPVPARERERERDTVIYKERDEVDSRGPAYLRDDYGRNSSAGAMVLRARDKEDVTYSSRRRRSPSVERKDREEIIIRRDERSESRPPPSRQRERSRDREEIIIRRDERSESRPEPPPPPPKPRERSREREEIIIRRDERSQSRPAAPRYRERERSREREEIIIKQREDDDRHYTPVRRAWTEDDRTREEIIIRRDERERDDDLVSRRSYQPPPPPPVTRDIDRQEIIIRRERDRRDEEERISRPISHERARSIVRSRSRDSEDEIIYRRDDRERGRVDESRQEIIIRRSSISRSPSPVESVRTAPPPPMPAPVPEPQIVYAPQIHQEVITHHRHIDHGYEVRQPIRREVVYERPPSPPSPPPAPPPESVRSRSEERIEIKRTDTRNGRRTEEEIIIDRNERDHSEPPPPPPRSVSRTRTEIDIREEIDTRQDWAVRPYRQPEPEPPVIGPRYGRPRDPRDGLWTEVTKDLVVKEAIEEMGYEYEETDEYYYVFKYMAYADVARLVGLSEDIKKQRHRRLNEIRWENSVSPRPAIEPAPPRRWIEPPVPPFRDRDRRFDREEDRYIEREVVYRGGRPPPPVGWRR